MSNIDKQALRYGDNVLWFLNELAAYDAGDIDGGEFDVYGENRNGLEGCSTIDVTELAADAAKLIEAAEKRIAELREWNAGLAQESFERQQRIAELEARTVKLPEPISVLHRRDFNDAHRAIYAYPEAEVDAALAAAGIGKGE